MERFINRLLPIALICILLLGSVFLGACDDDDEEGTSASQTASEPASAEPVSIATYTIADSTGDWGYPSRRICATLGARGIFV